MIINHNHNRPSTERAMIFAGLTRMVHPVGVARPHECVTETSVNESIALHRRRVCVDRLETCVERAECSWPASCEHSASFGRHACDHRCELLSPLSGSGLSFYARTRGAHAHTYFAPLRSCPVRRRRAHRREWMALMISGTDAVVVVCTVRDAMRAANGRLRCAPPLYSWGGCG